MNSETLAKLRSLCVSEVAFEQLKQTLTDEIQLLEQEIRQAHALAEQRETLYRAIARLREPIQEKGLIVFVIRAIYNAGQCHN